MKTQIDVFEIVSVTSPLERDRCIDCEGVRFVSIVRSIPGLEMALPEQHVAHINCCGWLRAEAIGGASQWLSR